MAPFFCNVFTSKENWILTPPKVDKPNSNCTFDTQWVCQVPLYTITQLGCPKMTIHLLEAPFQICTSDKCLDLSNQSLDQLLSNWKPFFYYPPPPLIPLWLIINGSNIPWCTQLGCPKNYNSSTWDKWQSLDILNLLTLVNFCQIGNHSPPLTSLINYKWAIWVGALPTSPLPCSSHHRQ